MILSHLVTSVLSSRFPTDPPHLQVLPPTLRSQYVNELGKVTATIHPEMVGYYWDNELTNLLTKL